MANGTKKYGRKVLSLILVFVMCLSMVQIAAAHEHEEISGDIEHVEVTLTVRYVDENGNDIANVDITGGMDKGSSYSTNSKPISGYIFKNWDFVSDSVAGIMNSDKEVIYIYTAKEVPEPEPTPFISDEPVYYPPSPDSGDGLVGIPDEDMPFAEAPQTGDFSALLLAMSAFSGISLALIGLHRKKEEA